MDLTFVTKPQKVNDVTNSYVWTLPIYMDPFRMLDLPDDSFQAEGIKKLNFVFEMERSACALFGVVMYGVHINIYLEVLGLDGKKCLGVWVPTHAWMKPTYVQYLSLFFSFYSHAPLLDSLGSLTTLLLVASGMPTSELLMKECMEEASLEADVVRKHVCGAGAISYFFRWNFEFRLLEHSLTFPKDLEGLATT